MPPCHIWGQLYLLVFQNLLHVLGRTVAEAFSHWPVNVEVKFRSSDCLYGIYGIKSGFGMGYFLSASIFFCQYSTRMLRC